MLSLEALCSLQHIFATIIYFTTGYKNMELRSRT